MTGGDPNKAEIEIELVGDGPGGDATKQMKELADATEKAADAEEDYQKKLAQWGRVLSGLARQRVQEEARQQREADRASRQQSRVQSGLARQRANEELRQHQENEQRKNRVTSGLARQRAQEEERQQRETETRRNRVLSGLAQQRVQEEKRREAERRTRPLTEMQQAGRRILSGEKEERIQKLMGQLAPKKGLAGLAQMAEGKLGLQSGSLQGLAGNVGKFGGVAAGVGMLAMAGKFAVDTGVTVSHQMQHGNPYADDFVRGREQVGNLPGADKFYALSDLVTGRSAKLQRLNRKRMEDEIESRMSAESFSTLGEQRRQEWVATLNAQSVRSIPLPNLPNTARGTVSQEHQYRLAQRLLPLEERRAEAARSAAEATNEQTANLERLQEQERRIAGFRGELNSAKAYGRTLGDKVGSPEYIATQDTIIRTSQRLEEAERERMRLVEAAKQGQQGVAGSRYQLAMAGVNVSQARLADLREREQTAASQGANLVMMGAAGRQQALFGMQMAKRVGLSNLPPEMISAAQSAFPETVRKMAEEEGQRLTTPYRRLAPDEYRDNLSSVRGQVDSTQKQIREETESANRAYKDAVAEAVKTGGMDGREIADLMSVAFKKWIEDAVFKMQIEQQQSAYNLPGTGR